MVRAPIMFALFAAMGISAASSIAQLPVFRYEAAEGDWLVLPTKLRAAVYRTAKPNEIVLANGLIARTFRVAPNAATVGFENLQTSEQLLRAVKPEARLVIDGKPFDVGGLHGQPNSAFLKPEWLDSMKASIDDFQYMGFEVGKTVAPFEWKRVRHSENRPWPCPGVSLTLKFGSSDAVGVDVRAEVRYELYDGAPILCKSIRVINRSDGPIQLNGFTAEVLGAVEKQSTVDANENWQLPNLSVLSDYAFGGFDNSPHCRNAYWIPDPDYSTQVNYERKTPCLLEVRPPIGPDQVIEPGKSFDSFRVFEVLHDSEERERKTLALRRFYRMMAPWSTENPIMLHLTSTDPKVVLPAIDQAAECGFEMVIISFWSGLDMENQSAENFAKFKAFREYANSKGIELGGYSLLASRRIDDANDAINPKTGKPGGANFGDSPCLCSKWGAEYFAKIRKFFAETGFQLLEHDGNYPGDVCASTTHPGHRGLADSQWNQWTTIRDFYRECRAKGVYLNVPDWYFLNGSNKTGMGYRESNWSLPREQQHIHARQNLFDGTFDKTPTMGWMMTPLVEYQGGGAAATIEPLKDHLVDYEQHLYNNFGYGAQSCYRGPRLYDSPETKKVVVDAVAWFKTYRAILESDVIHLKRPDGQKLDAILHVNPSLDVKGMLLVYNPSSKSITQTFSVPLHYTGIKGACLPMQPDRRMKRMAVSNDERIEISVTVPAMGRTWVALAQG